METELALCNVDGSKAEEDNAFHNKLSDKRGFDVIPLSELGAELAESVLL
ncbi:hypothetical protein [Sporolactobacillus pectinivorans]|nr:hypothetical protein [Sporolactobacillus pectinivorans]